MIDLDLTPQEIARKLLNGIFYLQKEDDKESRIYLSPKETGISIVESMLKVCPKLADGYDRDVTHPDYEKLEQVLYLLKSKI